MNKHPKYLNEGNEFDYLTVMSVVEDSKVDENNNPVWPVNWKYLCECECGGTVIVKKDDLIHKKKTHCGCKAWQKHKENKIEVCGDITKVFASNSDNFCLIDSDVWYKIKNYCWHESTNEYFRTYNRKHFDDPNLPETFEVGKTFSMHNYLAGLFLGKDVDHKNNNRADNRVCNLRVLTRLENTANRKKKKGEMHGVGFDKERGKWLAQIGVDYKNIFLGRYDTKEEAIKARREAEEMYYREASPSKYPYKTLETILTENGFPHEEKYG